MTSILQNLSNFDQQLWPQSSPVSLYHPLSPPITPFAPLFWTFRPHVSISSKCQPFYRYSLDFQVSRLFMIPCFQKTFLCKQRFVSFQMFTQEMLFTLISSFQNHSIDIRVASSLLIIHLSVASSSLKPQWGSLPQSP